MPLSKQYNQQHMKKAILISCLLFTFKFFAIAQTVIIPDANFVKWLTANIPSAMNGNVMDASNSAVQTLTKIDVENKGITDLTGVEYFPALLTLDCGNAPLGATPNSLTSLPSLPAKLETLICGDNQLTSLPVLPSSLIILRCYKNKLTQLPALPNSITHIDCHENLLDSLPTLPIALMDLVCSLNNLTNLPALPGSLSVMECNRNQLTELPELPASLNYLKCSSNLLKSLPPLPSKLISLECNANYLTKLPDLPAFLDFLRCSDNQLTGLPALPATLTYLECYNNKITVLPALPVKLQSFFCENNLLTSLPTLPDSLFLLHCSSNRITCFPVFPTTLTLPTFLSILPNPFSCLPNYVAAMDAATLAYPLCVAGDTTYNSHGCEGAEGIVGFTYKDVNSNCVKNTTDTPLINVHELLYDAGNTLLNQTYSATNGIYNFSEPAGTYTVKIDTVGVPFMAQCVQPGIDSTVVLTTGNPLVKDVNFSLTCKPGFDIGVRSVVTAGWVFPGMQHQLLITAGDLSHWYRLNCASGISGKVQITVSGPLTYTGIVPGARTPLVSGNMFTYTITDFGTVNLLNDFGLTFLTDTTAKAGDWICVSISVTPTSGDNNVSNNNFQFCYQVLNSHDPNEKQVYPTDVLPNYHDWFTYTIHFQNTGNAPANRIRLVDTLDGNLDLSTFQLLNYSHKNTVCFNKNELSFRFPNIMLADSTSDEKASHGYVQYRIKPKAGLPLGTKIKNTAFIYFDYNDAVVTNTTINNFTKDVSVKENQLEHAIKLYPNPGTGLYYVKLEEPFNAAVTMQVYDVLGRLIVDTKTQRMITTIDLSNQPNGVYILKVSAGMQLIDRLIIKQ